MKFLFDLIYWTITFIILIVMLFYVPVFTLIMLYSTGVLHPTEGLMSGWAQGKDCLNYTVLHSQEPKLSFE